jgi:hypothetical protein
MTTALHSADFHAHHSPMGAWATFTCGRHGAGGGMTIQGAAPAAHDLVIGWEDRDGLHCLPFCTKTEAAINMEAFGATEGADSPVVAEADAGANTTGKQLGRRQLIDARRDYRRGTDTWSDGRFAFTIHTPSGALPDPDRDGHDALAAACIPALAARLRFDNRAGTTPVTLLIAIAPGATCRLIESVGGAVAVGWGRECALASRTPGVRPVLEWNEAEWLVSRRPNRLGSTCGLALDIPAGAEGAIDLVFAFHRAGSVCTGFDASFFYTRRYPTLESVIADAIARHGALVAAAEALDRDPAWLALDADRRFLVAHAERSYWGNTWLLDEGGRPRWVVLEGEYAMHNTFDLTVDMAFYEAARNPWTLRNVLDQFVDRYAFTDRLARQAPNAKRFEHHTFARNPHLIHRYVPKPVETDLPGGISFCHDMGVGGHFTPAGMSSYECDRLAGCFSHMTCEQLYNWCLTAAIYHAASGDAAWVAWRLPVVKACLESLLNRDDPVPAKRNGVPGLDSSRCAGGWEITTYDSLDPSLGQARDNLYMAVKGWAAALGLARLLDAAGDAAGAATARAAAARTCATLAGTLDPKLGFIPAVFDGESTSAILPAVEGLVYPLAWGEPTAVDAKGPYAAMIAVLGRHLHAVLKPGLCLFPDGGWKLSSTADNSWISKIVLCQVVAERVYGIVPEPASHAAHARWQQIGSADWAMTDQCINGLGKGSRYYPRCVTADLWLNPVIAR